MSRTTTRDIIKITAKLARMDKKGKLEVLRWLQEQDLEAKPIVLVMDKEGGEQ